MKIAVVAGEPSGDFLGGGLIRCLAQRFPHAQFEGVGGPAMQEAGLTSFYPLSDLSVMGLFEVLRHLPRLLLIRRALTRHWHEQPPDLFIGIDSPDFNLPLARRLRASGVTTVQYVSPTVWAWREGRIKTLRAAVDQVLCIYPFEHDYFSARNMSSRFVGHPLADSVPLEPDAAAARRELGLGADGLVLALLPGSRASEISRLGPIFLSALSLILEKLPTLQVVIPCATPALRHAMEQLIAERGTQWPVVLLDGNARAALTAADVGLVASGTATLEALLCRCPAVMAYQVNAFSAAIGRRLIRVPYFAMPNLMAGEPLIPEFIQEQAKPAAIADAALSWLENPAQRAAINLRFADLHRALRRDADASAAAAVSDLVDGH